MSVDSAKPESEPGPILVPPPHTHDLSGPVTPASPSATGAAPYYQLETSDFVKEVASLT